MNHLAIRILGIVATFAAATSSLAASTTVPPATTAPALTWRGDLATARPLMVDLAAAWKKAGHGSISVHPFSTLAGLDALAAGSADLAGSARPAFQKRGEESALDFVPVAWDGLVMAVHRGNPVHDVSLKDLHDIYYGRIVNWSALGGPDKPINLYSVASPLDGIEYSLREYLFRRGNQPVASPRLYINTEQLEAAIAIDPYGLGVTTLSGAMANKDLRMLSVAGVAPTPANVADGSYPLYTPLYLVRRHDGAHDDAVGAFIAYLASDDAKAIMRAHFVLPYDATSLLAQGHAAHLVAMQDISRPPMDGPVAAPGASFAAGATRAPTSALTEAARARLEDQRAAEKKAADPQAAQTGDK